MSRELHVVFGTGALGRALLSALAEAGHRVRVVDLVGERLELPLGVEVRRGDPRNVDWALEVCEDADAVYDALLAERTNLFGVGLRRRAPARAAAAIASSLESFDRRRVTLEVVGSAPAADPERLEGRRVVGRIGDLFGGSWDRGPFPSTRALARGERVAVPGNPDLPHSWHYLPDVARALVVLGSAPEAEGSAWNLPSAPAVTTRELLRLACEASGRPGEMPRLRIIAAEEARYREPFLLSHTAFSEGFGAAFRVTPLDQAVAATVEWEETAGRLD